MESNSKMLVFRYKNFKGYDFVNEHNNILENNGYTWILKLGNKIKEKSIKSVIDSTGILLLKAPKKDGGNTYMCKVVEFQNGKLDEENIYPQYYKEIREENQLVELDGSWFKIISMKKISEEAYMSLKLCNNNRKLIDVINETRTVIMYVYSDEMNLFNFQN